MVLGLYYISKIRPGAKGEGLSFYGPEEAIIAHNEGKCDLHALVTFRQFSAAVLYLLGLWQDLVSEYR